jgi:acyl-CoA thioesterase-1
MKSAPTLALLLWLLLSSCSSGAEPTDEGFAPESLARPAADAGREKSRERLAIPADAPRVLFLGDSITAGLHLERDQAFPALVQAEFARAGLPFQLVNAGVSGDTSAGGLRRLDWLLGQEPDVLVLELGGNDGLRGQPVAEIEARLGQIVARVQEAGARVLLLGMRLPPSLGASYVRDFEELYGRLAERTGCAYLPFFMRGAAGDAAFMLDDGIHPNAAGHERIAANVAPALRALLEAPRETR